MFDKYVIKYRFNESVEALAVMHLATGILHRHGILDLRGWQSNQIINSKHIGVNQMTWL